MKQHKVLIHIEHQSLCHLVGIGTHPTPLPQASVPFPRGLKGGGAHSPAAKGVGESQFRRLEKKLRTRGRLCVKQDLELKKQKGDIWFGIKKGFQPNY
jgi:hypothetical protein